MTARPPAQQIVTQCHRDRCLNLSHGERGSMACHLSWLTSGGRPMPVSFELGPGDRRCTIRFSGPLTLTDAQASLEWQISSGAWERGALLDMTDATGISIDFQH